MSKRKASKSGNVGKRDRREVVDEEEVVDNVAGHIDKVTDAQFKNRRIELRTHWVKPDDLNRNKPWKITWETVREVRNRNIKAFDDFIAESGDLYKAAAAKGKGTRKHWKNRAVPQMQQAVNIAPENLEEEVPAEEQGGHNEEDRPRVPMGIVPEPDENPQGQVQVKVEVEDEELNGAGEEQVAREVGNQLLDRIAPQVNRNAPVQAQDGPYVSVYGETVDNETPMDLRNRVENEEVINKRGWTSIIGLRWNEENEQCELGKKWKNGRETWESEKLMGMREFTQQEMFLYLNKFRRELECSQPKWDKILESRYSTERKRIELKLRLINSPETPWKSEHYMNSIWPSSVSDYERFGNMLNYSPGNYKMSYNQMKLDQWKAITNMRAVDAFNVELEIRVEDGSSVWEKYRDVEDIWPEGVAAFENANVAIVNRVKEERRADGWLDPENPEDNKKIEENERLRAIRRLEDENYLTDWTENEVKAIVIRALASVVQGKFEKEKTGDWNREIVGRIKSDLRKRGFNYSVHCMVIKKSRRTSSFGAFGAVGDDFVVEDTYDINNDTQAHVSVAIYSK